MSDVDVRNARPGPVCLPVILYNQTLPVFRTWVSDYKDIRRSRDSSLAKIVLELLEDTLLRSSVAFEVVTLTELLNGSLLFS